MGIKETVVELLRQGDEERLVRLAAADGRALRPLSGRLWDADPAVRHLAARAIGELAAAQPELGREFVRRALWGLNDESATNGREMIPALGEIGARSPQLMAEFIAPLAAFAEDDSLRLAILDTMATIASRHPGLVRPLRAALADRVDADSRRETAALERLEVLVDGGAEA